MSTSNPYLTNHFLIAMPGLHDPNFERTVTLICEHNKEGALGLVINRRIDIEFSDILAQMEISPAAGVKLNLPVYQGGPVQENRGFVLHQPIGNWESTLPVAENLGLTSSRDILGAIAQGKGPERHILTLGYAGWGAGQLEREILDNAWLSGEASYDIIFDLPEEARWEAAAMSLGINLNALSGDAGHA